MTFIDQDAAVTSATPPGGTGSHTGPLSGITVAGVGSGLDGSGPGTAGPATGVTVQVEAPRQAAVLDLLRQSDEYTLSLYPSESAYLLDINELEAPGVSVFVARRDGVARGIAALATRNNGTAELKRVFVDPAARGSGVAGSLLRAVEAAALGQGIGVLQLETGEPQPEAIALYTKVGFERIPRFGQYTNDPLSVCMQKVLAPPRP